MKKCCFIVYGILGKQRPRASIVGGRAHIYTPNKTKAYEKWIAEAYKDAGGVLLEKPIPVMVSILIFHGAPKSASKKRRAAMLEQKSRPTKRPDVDNVAKCVLDGLNGVAYEDDSQVVTLEVRKYWGNEDYIEVHVLDRTP